MNIALRATPRDPTEMRSPDEFAEHSGCPAALLVSWGGMIGRELIRNGVPRRSPLSVRKSR